MFRIAEEEPDLTGVPETLTGLVTACLAKDPQRRPTAEQLAVLPLTDADGPWLPAELLAELGRLAARVLTVETPPQGSPAPARFKWRWRPVLATVVALAAVATGTALALRGDGEKDRTAGGALSTTASASNPASTSAGPGIPDDFIGAWEGVLKGDTDLPKRVLRLDISPGGPGDKVATYIDTGGDLQCTGRGKLVSADADTLVVGTGQVTAGLPQGRCTPLPQQTLKVRSKDVLVWKSGGMTADFYRSVGGQKAVPDQYVGTWVPANETYRAKELLRISQGPVGGRLVRMSVTADMDDGTEQYCDGTFVIGAVSPVLALSPATYTTESGKGCRQPDAVFFTAARNGNLLLFSMDADAEPAEYVRKS